MSSIYRLKDFPGVPFAIDQFMFMHTVTKMENGAYRVRGQLHYDWWVDAYFSDLNGYAEELIKLDLTTLKLESEEALKSLRVEFDQLERTKNMESTEIVNKCRNILSVLRREVVQLDGELRKEQQSFYQSVVGYLSQYYDPSLDE